jgi:CRP-like cAMP-binding protein
VITRVALDNSILQKLPRNERNTMLPALELVRLPLHSVLNETGMPVRYGYFVTSGLASVLTVLKHNKIVEVGLTGSEGFVGLPLVAGLRTSAVRVIAQTECTALRINAKQLKKKLGRCPVLRKCLEQYALEIAAQANQIAACNRLHDANQRLARWLLMSQDRLGGDVMHLTQEFLAHMLGMRRASVTVAVGFLQKAGLIKYTRGMIRIKDRGRLEAAACECYAAITRHQARWQKESR